MSLTTLWRIVDLLMILTHFVQMYFESNRFLSMEVSRNFQKSLTPYLPLKIFIVGEIFVW